MPVPRVWVGKGTDYSTSSQTPCDQRVIVKIIFNSIRGYHVDETDWNIIVGDVALSPFKDSVFRSRRMQPGGIDGNGNQIFRFCRFDLMNHRALHLARICLWLH